MVKGSRNLCLYPNVYLMDQFSTQIRHFRPIAPDRTEVTIYCIAPKGESAQARAHRIRQYEDFFNASGMATPDDTVSYENCQRGFASRVEPWLQGYARGMAATKAGGNLFSDASQQDFWYHCLTMPTPQ